MGQHMGEDIGVLGDMEASISNTLVTQEQAAGEAAVASTASASTAWSYTRGYASYIFWLMFSINVINYVDRWVFGLLLPLIQTDQTFCEPGTHAEFCIN